MRFQLWVTSHTGLLGTFTVLYLNTETVTLLLNWQTLSIHSHIHIHISDIRSNGGSLEGEWLRLFITRVTVLQIDFKINEKTDFVWQKNCCLTISEYNSDILWLRSWETIYLLLVSVVQLLLF